MGEAALPAKQADGSWVLRIAGPGERLTLPSIGCELEVDQVYRDVFGEAAG